MFGITSKCLESRDQGSGNREQRETWRKGRKCWPRWFRVNRQMFASMVRKQRKCSLRWLQKFEGLTFQTTRICELAAGKVPNRALGLQRITRRFCGKGSIRTGNGRKVLKMLCFTGFSLTGTVISLTVVRRGRTRRWG